MSSILDYIDWRGDLTFRASPFNEVDNLILTQLSFVNWEKIAEGKKRRESITLREAAACCFKDERSRASGLGVLIPDEIPVLLEKAAKSGKWEPVEIQTV